MFKNLGVKAQLLMSFAVVIVFTLIISVTSTINLFSIVKAAGYVHTGLAVKRAHTSDALNAARAVRSVIMSFATDLNNFNAENVQKCDEGFKLMDSKLELLPKAGDARQKDIDELRKTINSIKDYYYNSMVPALRNKDATAVDNIFNQQVYPAFSKIVNLSEKLNNAIINDVVSDVDKLNSYTPVYIVLALAIVALILAIMIALYLSNAITGAINTAVDTSERISGGDLSQPVHSNRTDELGYLINSLEKHKNYLMRLCFIKVTFFK